MGTLTYEGDGCHDADRMRQDVASFWRALRRSLGGEPLPYVWVPEWHPEGHGLHVHWALGQYVHKSKIRDAWGRGFVHVRRFSGMRHGSTRRDAARLAARYLAKYVAKTFDESAGFGRHRYEVAQGFQPERVLIRGIDENEVLSAACDLMGGRPERFWSSDTSDEWRGAPTRWFQWD